MVSQEALVGRTPDSVTVVANALPAGRLPVAHRSVVDASEHEVRSAAAEILTSTWLGVRDAISAARAADAPASIVVVIPPGGVGRAGNGLAGVMAAGAGALVRTAARELRAEGIAVNGVQIGTSTNADDVARTIAMFDGASAAALSGQIIRLDDLAPTWPDPGGPYSGPDSGARPGTEAGAGEGTAHGSGDEASDGPALGSERGGSGRFTGKVALVTGAVRPPHMGRSTALRLAREGADVALLDAPTHGGGDADSDATEPGALDDLRAEIESLGRRCHPIEAVVGGQDQADHLVDVVVAAFGRLDVVCHFGGGTGPRLGTAPLAELTDEAWQTCLETNLLSPWFTAVAAARQFRTVGHRGSIVLLSSYAVTDTPERYGAFTAARSVVVALAEQLAREVGADGVRINTVLPLGVTPPGAPNPGLADLVRSLGSDTASWAADRIPAGRTQLATETAAVAAFLASDDASFVNGQAVATSGGAADRPLW